MIYIISGAMLSSPLLVVAYDYIEGRYTNEEGKEKQDEIDTQTWWF